MPKTIAKLVIFTMIFTHILGGVIYAQEYFNYNETNNETVTLVKGMIFNAKIKSLANKKNIAYSDKDTEVKAIKKSEIAPGDEIITDNLSDTQNNSILAWYEDDTIRYYTTAKTIEMNSNSDYMFLDFSELRDISGLKWFSSKNTTSMTSIFSRCTNLSDISALNNRDTSNVTSMNSMFSQCDNLNDITALKNWNTSKVNNMRGLFHGCSNLNDISALSNWDSSSVIDMGLMFGDCSNLKNVTALSNWNTNRLTDMSWMFDGCNNLNDISGLKNWDTSNVTDMGLLFFGCSNLGDVTALKNWDTSRVVDMGSMFNFCSNLNDVSGLNNRNVSSVTDMSFMFHACNKLPEIDLSNRDTSRVTKMNNMFDGCYNLKKIYSTNKLNLERVMESTEMFKGTYDLVGGNGTIYNINYIDKTYARIDTQNTPGYFTNKNNIDNGIEKSKQSNPQKNKISQNGYTTEMNNAYEFAYKNGITTINSIDKANMNSPLTRIAMAKMLSNYAINVLGKQPNSYKGIIRFNDVPDNLNKQYDNAVILAYQLGIMGQNIRNNNFRPYDLVTRAEFATALSRLIYGIEDGKGNTKYYEPHITKLYNEGIINNKNPEIEEKRGYVMIMLMRSSK